MQQKTTATLTRILHAPHQLDALQPTAPLDVLLYQVLNDAERVRDAAPTREDERAGEGGVERVLGAACATMANVSSCIKRSGARKE